MQEIVLKGIDEKIYYEQLDNGLPVYMLVNDKVNNFYMTLSAKYGSIDTEYKCKGDKEWTKVHNGVAHFLEHVNFNEGENETAHEYFNKLGSSINAFTTFDFTLYEVFASSEFEKNLNHLLDYVQTPYFTKKLIEKEKGIIKEEIKRQKDIPEWVLEMKIREAVYREHPRRISIAGEVEDIDGITKEELYDCYNTFYQPNNMFLVAVGNFSIESAMAIIKKELGTKVNTQGKARIRRVKESKNVANPDMQLSLNVKIPKIALGYKMPFETFQIKDHVELDLYLNMFASLLFGSSSLFKERVRNNNLMTSFYYEWETIKGYKTLLIFAETENPELLIGEVEKELQNIETTVDDIERIKKVWISNEVKAIDYIESMVSSIIEDKISYNKVIFNRVDLIKKIHKKKLDEIISKMDFTNRAKVILLPNKIITKEQ